MQKYFFLYYVPVITSKLQSIKIHGVLNHLLGCIKWLFEHANGIYTAQDCGLLVIIRVSSQLSIFFPIKLVIKAASTYKFDLSLIKCLITHFYFLFIVPTTPPPKEQREYTSYSVSSPWPFDLRSATVVLYISGGLSKGGP